MCAGKQAACMLRPTDWITCPAFLEERARNCPCYESDLELISRIESKWHAGELVVDGVMQKDCMGFTEVGFPILVHDNLVGVTITGQMFLSKKEICSIEKLVEKWSLLKGSEDELETARHALFWNEENMASKQDRRFLITETELRRRVGLLRPNIQRVTEILNSKYFEMHNRTESAFRQEILNIVRASKSKPTFFTTDVTVLLARMREFWGFETALLARHSSVTGNISVIGFCNEHKNLSFKFPGRKIGSTKTKYLQSNPCCYLYRFEPREWLNPFVEKIVSVINSPQSGLDFQTSTTQYCFFVVIPLFREIFSFIFAGCDEKAVSRTRESSPKGLSPLCQEAIFRTCSEVLYAFPPSPPEKPLAFICHDSRDKESVARPLATELSDIMCPVWFDEFSLKVGDSLRQSVERGIKECRKCILILSPNFLANNGWTKKEFNAIFTKEIFEQKNVILPVWYHVSAKDVYQYSPNLADRFAVNWSLGVKEVVKRLYEAVIT